MSTGSRQWSVLHPRVPALKLHWAHGPKLVCRHNGVERRKFDHRKPVKEVLRTHGPILLCLVRVVSRLKVGVRQLSVVALF